MIFRSEPGAKHLLNTVAATKSSRCCIFHEQGPDHSKCFKIAVEIGGRRFDACWGQTKKKAEQEAALAALRELGVIRELEGGELRVVAGES